jgi:hypothetical protein
VRFLVGVLAAFCAFLLYLYRRSESGLDPDKAHDQFVGMLVAMAVAAFFVAVMAWAVNRRSVELTESELTINAGFYSRTLKRESLRVEAGRMISLFEDRSIAPRWRTNGIRVPGFQAGWFRLANGDKALALLTDPRAVTYLPTTEGYALLISTSELLPALTKAKTV